MQVAVSISSMFHAHYEANANTKMLFAILASIVKYLMPKCECWNFCPEVFQDRKLQKSLCLSPHTVHNHIRNASVRIGVHKESELIAYAHKHNLFKEE